MGPIRSNRATLFIVGAIFFIAAFVGLAYNNLEQWDIPEGRTKSPGEVTDDGTLITTPEGDGKPPAENVKLPAENIKPAPANEPLEENEPAPPASADIEDEEALRQFYLKHIMKPSIGVDESPYRDSGAFEHELPEKKLWKKPLGENFCVIDIDNRDWTGDGELWSKKTMSWDRQDKIHGLSLGILNHWLYAKIHGYKYYFVDFVAPTDRRASWAKPAIIREILKHHDACVFMDSDAAVHHLDIPFEWLMNFWGLHPTTNSFALAFDPKHPNNEDKFKGVYLNTGFIVLQNNKKTFEILDEWEACPEPGGKHPDCVDFRNNKPGKPTDQGGFGTYIRYDYPAPDIISLPCNEANGYPEAKAGCDGTFIRHFWTGKKTWIKVLVKQQIPGKFMELFHKKFREEKDKFWIKEKDLGTLGEGKIGGSFATE